MTMVGFGLGPLLAAIMITLRIFSIRQDTVPYILLLGVLLSAWGG